MHWAKRAIFGMFLTFFLFILFGFLSNGGINLFRGDLMTVTGFFLVLCMGAIETSFVFYE